MTFFDLKGVLENFFKALKMDSVRYTKLEAADCNYLKPGYGSKILATSGETEVTLGVIGEVHPEVASNFELRQTAFIFELNLEVLMPAMPATPQSQPTPKYPSITRDITIIVKKDIEAHAILTDIRSLKKEEKLIESVNLLDLYEGSNVSEDSKSLSFRFTYRFPRQDP